MPVKQSLNTSHYRQRALALFVVTCAATLPLQVMGQGWTFEPVLRVGAESDDNAQMAFRTDEEIKLEGFLADLAATVKYESRRDQFEIEPRVLIRNYSDEPEFDSDDLFFRSLYQHQLQNSDYGFALFFDRQQVRTAERADTDLDAEDIDEITDDDSGRVGLMGERNRWRLLPNFSHQFSPKSSIDANLAYYNVRYDDVVSGFLTDFDDLRLDLAYRYAYTETTTGILLGSGRDYETKDDLLPRKLNGYGAQVGFERALSDTTTVRALIGMESTDLTNQDRVNEVVGELVLRRQLQTIRLLARYQRLVNASGAGRLSIRDSLSLNATRNLNERMSAGLGLRAYQDDPLGVSNAVEQRQYVQVRARFTWYLATSFSTELDYRYTVLDRGDLIGEGANSNQINIWFSYHPYSDAR
ncbi:MAG TPA: hypothetical protein PKK10_04680 [Woeseiaceae bacterium]|nr:hypothetical protein [Woeseiaceae bacterium]